MPWISKNHETRHSPVEVLIAIGPRSPELSNLPRHPFRIFNFRPEGPVLFRVTAWVAGLPVKWRSCANYRKGSLASREISPFPIRKSVQSRQGLRLSILRRRFVVSLFQVSPVQRW